MIGYYFICKENGTCRIIDYHYDDPRDPDAVRTMHARHPPVLSVDLQVGSDERVFNAQPTTQEIAKAFAVEKT